MYQATITVCDRQIKIIAGRNRIYKISSKIYKGDCTKTAISGGSIPCQMYSPFGTMWTWEDFPEKKEKHDRLFREYAAKLPAVITSRTDLKTLPSVAWVNEFLPTEKQIEEIREAKKTPEEKQAEINEKNRRQEEYKKAKEEKEKRNTAIRENVQKMIAENPGLITDNSLSNHAKAARNIKYLLAKKWPGITWSVKSESYTGGDRIDVKWTDGPTEEAVKTITIQFEEGYFDGMDDMYHYDSTPLNDILGGVKYVFESRSISPEFTATIKAKIASGEIAAREGIDEERQIYKVSRDMEYFPEVTGTPEPVQSHTPATPGTCTGCALNLCGKRKYNRSCKFYKAE